MKEPRLYLEEILSAMEAIEEFIKEMDFETFQRDLKTKSAVVNQLAVMGEAAKMIPMEIKANYPGVAWKNMGGMRDRLIHGYFQVDYGLIWDAIKTILPKEKRVIERILEDIS